MNVFARMASKFCKKSCKNNIDAYLIEVSVKGLDDISFRQGFFRIESQYIESIEFVNNRIVRFYIKKDIKIPNEKNILRNECCNILLRLYIQLLKEGTYFLSNLVIEDPQLTPNGDDLPNIALREGMRFTETVIAIRRDGMSEKERAEEIHTRVEKILISSYENSKYLCSGNEKKIQKLLEIEDPVIKYFLTYSWICELCDPSGKHQQKNAEEFICKSAIFKNIPQEMQWKQRLDTRRKSEEGTPTLNTEDIFTYLRNVIGHSVNEILDFSDKAILWQIEKFGKLLLLVLLEKFEEQKGKE